MPGGPAIDDGFSGREFPHDRLDRHRRPVETTGQRSRPAFSHPAQRIPSAPAKAQGITFIAVAPFASQLSELPLQHLMIPQAG